MKKKSEAHEKFSLLLQRYGAPLRMIMDGSKYQTLGNLKNNCQEASCHIRKTETQYP